LKKKILNVLNEYIDGEIVLEKPKDVNFGHFATPVAFSLAKKLRKSPVIIAKELSKKLLEEEIFSSVEAVNGYINFKLENEFLDKFATWSLQNENEVFAE